MGLCLQQLREELVRLDAEGARDPFAGGPQVRDRRAALEVREEHGAARSREEVPGRAEVPLDGSFDGDDVAAESVEPSPDRHENPARGIGGSNRKVATQSDVRFLGRPERRRRPVRWLRRRRFHLGPLRPREEDDDYRDDADYEEESDEGPEPERREGLYSHTVGGRGRWRRPRGQDLHPHRHGVVPRARLRRHDVLHADREVVLPDPDCEELRRVDQGRRTGREGIGKRRDANLNDVSVRPRIDQLDGRGDRGRVAHVDNRHRDLDDVPLVWRHRARHRVRGPEIRPELHKDRRDGIRTRDEERGRHEDPDVNRLPPEVQRAELSAIAPELLEKTMTMVGPKELPPLPNAVDGKVVLRLAPYPSGPLHIGNARAFVLNDAYAKKYHGKLLLVFDDTIGSEDKPLLPEAFDQVREGLDWAGVEFHEVLYKSDRIPLHYEWAEKLLSTGEAYVCECDAETLRKNREAMKACVHRIQSVDETIAMWKAMLAGEYAEGEAVVRLRTAMADPNPAFRDRVLFRIAERDHPRVGDRYRVWPMLEFSWAVDDSLLGVTHVLRGKDLVMEDQMETRIWDIRGIGRRPEFVHFGILRFKDLELSKSRYRKEIAAGHLTGIDDPRTWSLQSLRRRGIRPAALREFVLSFGLSLNDIEVPAETLYAENRKMIDKDANRYFFVPDPVAVEIAGLPPIEHVSKAEVRAFFAHR